MTKSQRFTAFQQDGAMVATHYRTVQAMAADLGVQVYHDTYRTGRLLRDGQGVGTWVMWTWDVMRTQSIAAENLGVGDQFNRGGKLHTVTMAITHDELVELTTTTYSELKRDYVAKISFVVRSKIFPVIAW